MCSLVWLVDFFTPFPRSQRFNFFPLPWQKNDEAQSRPGLPNVLWLGALIVAHAALMMRIMWLAALNEGNATIWGQLLLRHRMVIQIGLGRDVTQQEMMRRLGCGPQYCRLAQPYADSCTEHQMLGMRGRKRDRVFAQIVGTLSSLIPAPRSRMRRQYVTAVHLYSRFAIFYS